MTRGARTLYLAIGLVCVGLGVLGAVLPILPTTPFMLVALWAFSRSSSRLETWLLTHRVFGPRLHAWRAHHAIPLPVKLTAWGSMLASLTILVVGGAPVLVIAVAAVVMAIGATFIALRPSRPPPSAVVSERSVGE